MKNKFGCSSVTELLLKALQNDINKNVHSHLPQKDIEKLTPLSHELNSARMFSSQIIEIA